MGIQIIFLLNAFLIVIVRCYHSLIISVETPRSQGSQLINACTNRRARFLSMVTKLSY